MLIVVLRYRMGQWQRRKASTSMTGRSNGEPDTTQHQDNIVTPETPAETGEEPWVEINAVEAMVEGVKSKGVRCFFSCSDMRIIKPDDLCCALHRGVS